MPGFRYVSIRCVRSAATVPSVGSPWPTGLPSASRGLSSPGVTKRRSRGDGGLHWDERRQRWIATVTLGYDGRGKRVVRKGAGRTKTEAQRKLQEVMRDRDDGLPRGDDSYTVRLAVEEWLRHGLSNRSESTRKANSSLCRNHVLPLLGARKLRELTAREVDEWLANRALVVSTRTLRGVYACLNRSVKRAMARDKVKRNVVELCAVPTGRPGRPSRSLTADQAESILTRTTDQRMHAFLVVGLLTGARTGELRALRWEHVHLDEDTVAHPAVVPYVEVWRSVRAGGDTKTRKSRRTLALPVLCVQALLVHRERQEQEKANAIDRWAEQGLVFPTRAGTLMDKDNARRAFRTALGVVPGLDPGEWTPRELRHSFVSLLSDAGVPIEEISRLVGHSGTSVTELVYRHQIRPVIQSGAEAMDALFGPTRIDSHSLSHSVTSRDP